MRLAAARTPDSLRIYAIGDIHGCLTQLEDLYRQIDDDLASEPTPAHRIVHLGDYVDRGPDSRGVVERLSKMAEKRSDVDFIRGNHDVNFLEFLSNPAGLASTFLSFGGVETLRSYGCRDPAGRDPVDLASEARGLVPGHHLDFLASAKAYIRHGDYYFCHAGVRPGIALSDQNDDDLMWIREEFLESDVDFGVIVVHGHTPSSTPGVKSNRIGIDTGAVFGGPLTAVVLEDNRHRFLQAQQPGHADFA